MAERNIRENHVGRDIPRVCQLLAEAAQSLEQPGIAGYFPAAAGHLFPRQAQRAGEQDGQPLFESIDPLLRDGHGGEFIFAGGEQPEPQQLPPEIDPIRARLVFPDAVGAERVVFPALDFLRHSTGQDLGHVVQADAEISHLADPQHAAKQLLDVGRGVPFFARAEAVIATAAVFRRPCFPEVAEQADAAAGVVLGKVRHLIELAAGHVARLLVGDFFEEFEVFHHVAAGKEQQAVRRQSVAPRASRFLVVALDVLRQIRVDDVADVRLVDAHAEGDGGADDLRLVPQEGVLIPRTLVGIEAGMIGDGGKSLRPQRGGEGFSAFAGLAVNDPGLAGTRVGEVANLRRSPGLGNHLVFEIWPIEAGQKDCWIAEFELLDDVLADALGGGGRERQHGNIGKPLRSYLLQTAVFRPEIMTPLADAVGLVHRKGRSFPTLQAGQKIWQHQPLRGHV